MAVTAGKTTAERNKLIAASLLGVLALAALYFAFGRSLFGGSSSAAAKATPTPKPTPAANANTGTAPVVTPTPRPATTPAKTPAPARTPAANKPDPNGDLN